MKVMRISDKIIVLDNLITAEIRKDPLISKRKDDKYMIRLYFNQTISTILDIHPLDNDGYLYEEAYEILYKILMKLEEE